jgi:hypothetical protein
VLPIIKIDINTCLLNRVDLVTKGEEIMKRHFSMLAVAAAVALACSQAPANAISVVAEGNADNLVNSLLGSGITLVSGTASLTGGDSSAGFFSDGTASGIVINKGVILSSGSIFNALGPNENDGQTTDFNLPGDSDLTKAAGQDTFDATILQFDFTTAGGDLYFNYVFASEEYNEFVNAYNDVFGFYLDGENIALIPSTTTPVSVNTININSNPELFNNNDITDFGIPTPFNNIQYDGFTKVLTAKALGLGKGTTHTIKLAIADSGDHVLDSAVFLQANSFSEDPTAPVPEPTSMLLGLLGLGGAFGLKRRK